MKQLEGDKLAIGFVEFQLSQKNRWYQPKFCCDHVPGGMVSCPIKVFVIFDSLVELPFSQYFLKKNNTLINPHNNTAKEVTL